MAPRTAPEYEGVFIPSVGDGGYLVIENGRRRSQQPFCCCLGGSCPGYLCPYLQAYQRENLCWTFPYIAGTNSSIFGYTAVIPCAVLSLFVHPATSHILFNRICWAFCVYLEAISVRPQLRLMKNIQIIEPFTAHYVFALGYPGLLLIALGRGVWPCFVLLSEIVQTFILADFFYYYVKSIQGGQLVVRLPADVV
ncbi:Plant neutral invertase family protein [Hibiscus syriacus]|uniref:Plant neutral invertase family protein n=1 Tax=Hibiscus syriacus TaxID=106335 RepID=A0A6A3CQ03_HIBSY|nr:Plant neutral invertase family protein [Hibiscus syriacus]